MLIKFHFFVNIYLYIEYRTFPRTCVFYDLGNKYNIKLSRAKLRLEN